MEGGVVVDVPVLGVDEEGGVCTVVATVAGVVATAKAVDTEAAAAMGEEAAEGTGVIPEVEATGVIREGEATGVIREGEATGLVEWVEDTRAVVGMMAMEGLEGTRSGRREIIWR